MIRLPALILILSLLAPLPGRAERYTYDYTENSRKAYEMYMSLHFREGRAWIVKEMRQQPYNLFGTYIADYEDCLLLLMNCNRADYDQRAAHFDERLQLLDNGDRTSPWYRLCKAGVYMHWALVHTRFGEQYSAAIDFHKSFLLLKENAVLFPGFRYNDVFGGLQQAVIGSLPGNYKWLASIFGMRGDVKKGTGMLGQFVRTHAPGDALYDEAVLYSRLTRFYLLHAQAEVWAELNTGTTPAANLLQAFMTATIGLDYRKADAVIDVLDRADADSSFGRFPILKYQQGVALLTRLDTNCRSFFRAYLAASQSDLLIKDCWQKMAFSYYIEGNTSQATLCMSLVDKRGTSRVDPDKQAYRFAQKGIWPDRQLLKARLLLEGGYHSRAMELLQAMDGGRNLNPSDQVEYLFRMGRAYEEGGTIDKALEYYAAAAGKGHDSHEQYGARAELQMGLIYEHTGRSRQALEKYRECLDMPAHDFQNSIDQQAKAGINRLEAE